jgi:hypothetical protein
MLLAKQLQTCVAVMDGKTTEDSVIGVYFRVCCVVSLRLDAAISTIWRIRGVDSDREHGQDCLGGDDDTPPEFLEGCQELPGRKIQAGGRIVFGCDQIFDILLTAGRRERHASVSDTSPYYGP